jgi:hypothetical protein
MASNSVLAGLYSSEGSVMEVPFPVDFKNLLLNFDIYTAPSPLSGYVHFEHRRVQHSAKPK